jgi:tetratricopeptide (TPR) repeat protein
MIPLHERTLADRERVLGPAHPDTLASRNNLAAAYQDAAGAPRRSRCTSAPWPTTSGSWARTTPAPCPPGINLATAYRDAGRAAEAIALFERALADLERVLGPDHPDTMTVRDSLAAARASQG